MRMNQYTREKTVARTYLGLRLKTVRQIFFLALLVAVGLYSSPHQQYEENPLPYPQMKLSVENLPIVGDHSPEIADIQLQKLAIQSSIEQLQGQKQTTAVHSQLLVQQKMLKLIEHLEDNTRQLAYIREGVQLDSRIYENRIQQLKSQIHRLKNEKH